MNRANLSENMIQNLGRSSVLSETSYRIGRWCRRCREHLIADQADCPMCGSASVPLDEAP